MIKDKERYFQLTLNYFTVYEWRSSFVNSYIFDEPREFNEPLGFSSMVSRLMKIIPKTVA